MSTGSPERPGPTGAGPRPARGRGRLVAAGLGIVAFGVLLGFLLTTTLRPRMGEDDVITGGVMSQTGRVELNPAAPAAPAGPAAPEAPGPTDAELEALAKKAEAAPGDVEAQLALVRAAIDAERGDLALPALDRILKKEPDHPGALTYLGLMTSAQGRYDHGLELIEQALQAAPGDPFALWAKGGVLFSHRRDYAGAAAAWEAMIASSKVDAATRATVREWIAEARWRAQHAQEMAGRERPGGAPGGPAAPGAVAGGGPAERATEGTSAPAGRPFVSGTVSLGPGVSGGAAQPGALFVIARRGAGPPVAVKRIESPRFPVAYSLGPEDTMLQGRPVEGDLEIVARLARSGGAGPARPGDLEGRFGRSPVRPGATGVDIVLAPVSGGPAAATSPAR